LNDYSSGRMKQKRFWATKICTHFNRIRLPSYTKGRNRLYGVGHIKEQHSDDLGPTGVGKTYLIK